MPKRGKAARAPSPIKPPITDVRPGVASAATVVMAQVSTNLTRLARQARPFRGSAPIRDWTAPSLVLGDLEQNPILLLSVVSFPRAAPATCDPHPLSSRCFKFTMRLNLEFAQQLLLLLSFVSVARSAAIEGNLEKALYQLPKCAVSFTLTLFVPTAVLTDVVSFLCHVVVPLFCECCPAF